MTIHSLFKKLLFSGLLMCVVIALAAPLTSLPAYAAIEAVEFEDPAMMERYQKLIAELRCLVCQNQTLADSNAELAKDLRRKTIEMLNDGNTDQEILDYMRERYGDFVLYRPPFSWSTSLIWLGPFLLLIIAIAGLLLNIRRRQQQDLAQPAGAGNDEQIAKLHRLMEKTPELTRTGVVRPEDRPDK